MALVQTPRVPEKVPGITIIRCTAFAAVFTSHTMWTRCQAIWGGWGVSAFLVLSGFCMTYNYIFTGRVQNCGIKQNLAFVLRKIKSLWLLHMLITFLSISYTWVPIDLIKQFGVVLIGNTFMIQEWLPFRQSGMLNGGVSWYLSTVVFAYFIFPWVIKYMEKNYSGTKALSMCAILLLIQLIVGLCSSTLSTVNRGELSWWEDNWCHWLLYRFPPVRTIEFLLGCNIAYLCLYNKKQYESRIRWTVYEFTAVALTASSVLIAFLYRNNNKIVGSQQWWTHSLIYVIPTMILVYVFAQGKGTITERLKKNGLIQYISDGSSWAFLIHYIVFKWVRKYIEDRGVVSNYYELVILIFGALGTWIFTALWVELIKNKGKSTS